MEQNSVESKVIMLFDTNLKITSGKIRWGVEKELKGKSKANHLIIVFQNGTFTKGLTCIREES